MTGPEHYQRAEIAQEAAAALQASRDPGPEYTATEALLDALVHATLALTAATALRTVDGALPQPDYRAWHDAAATRQEVTRG